MNEYHTSTKDPKVADVCRAAYPDYKGLKCKVVFTDKPVDMASYWDGGTRTYYKVLRLADCKVLEVPAQHPVFDKTLKGADRFEIPPGFVVVAHVIFCGKDLGLRIYARPDGSDLLPAPSAELSTLESDVLYATKAYKSSYAGYSDYRAAELRRVKGYTKTQIDAARESLRALGYLDKRNAITNAGRNALSAQGPRWSL